MTDYLKAMKKEIAYFERWCDKQQSERYACEQPSCNKCIKYYFAGKIVKLKRKIK
jgi:hypothetical protein